MSLGTNLTPNMSDKIPIPTGAATVIALVKLLVTEESISEVIGNVVVSSANV